MERKQYQIFKLMPTLDEFGQSLKDYVQISTSELNITIKDQSVDNNNPLYIDSTHVAIGYVNEIDEGYKITDGDKSYIVKLVVPSRRQSYILLKEMK